MGDGNSDAAASLAKMPASSSSSLSFSTSLAEKQVEAAEKEPVVKEAVIKRRVRTISRFKDGELSLACEWGECRGVVSIRMKDCFLHVSIHIQQYLMQVLGPTQRTSLLSGGLCLTCGWRNCGAQILGSVIDYNRHVYFHVLHMRLKGLGAHLVQQLSLGVCLLGKESCNWIPELPDNLKCQWGQCQIIFDNPYNFYSHVAHHTEECTVIRCRWEGCKLQVRDRNKLKDHLRSHTQEKLVACPTCGGLFSSTTKLTDHILRQASTEHLRYECSHCSRRFSTERMLREHMRRHVNTYKCSKCEMTCPSPSTLRMHFRYKHSDDKPFKCGHCKFSAKSSTDLRKHLDTHNVEDQFSCHMAKCPFSARSYNSLALHFKKHHESMDVSIPRYICHVCQRVYTRGFYLTHHLKEKHNFEWPPGHSRFRYKMHSDGYLHLQTVRYECADLEEVAPKASDKRSASRVRPKKRIVTTFTNPGPTSTTIQNEAEKDSEDRVTPSLAIMEDKSTGDRRAEELPPLDVSATSVSIVKIQTTKKKSAPSLKSQGAANARRNPGKGPSLHHATGNLNQGEKALDMPVVEDSPSASARPTLKRQRKRGRKTSLAEEEKKLTASAAHTSMTGNHAKPPRKRAVLDKTSGEVIPAVSRVKKQSTKRELPALAVQALGQRRKKGGKGARSQAVSSQAPAASAEEALASQQQQETLTSEQQHRPPTFMRSTSLDECPPQMVEICWMEASAQPGPSEEWKGDHVLAMSTGSGAVGMDVSEGGASQMISMSGDGANHVMVGSEGEASQMIGMSGDGANHVMVEAEGRASQMIGMSGDGANHVMGVAEGGANPVSAQDLQVAHYRDSADANLHMLGDVALTKLQ